LNKKQILKKAKKDKVLRSQLRKEMAAFLANLRRCTTKNPIDEWNDLLLSGLKGYSQLRNKELITRFEYSYSLLHDQAKPITFYAEKDSVWNCYGTRGFTAEEGARLRAEFMLEADVFMSRIMEEIFRFEELDEVKAEKTKGYHRSGNNSETNTTD
jgi:hypothetical protein